MQARLAEKPFSHPDWLFEPKLDGYRVLAFIRDGIATLVSRNGNDLTNTYPLVVDELQGQPKVEMVLDGEIVALDQEGMPDFGLLQRSSGFRDTTAGAAVMYYPFDLLYSDGMSLLEVPLSARKPLLAAALSPGERVKKVDFVEAEGEIFFQAAIQMGLEGMVAKRRDSLYVPGARSGSWLKIKGGQSQHFVVAGYTKGSGARSGTFGALLLSYYDGDSLRYSGRVGSGFDARTLAQLKELLTLLETDRCPLVEHRELSRISAQWVQPQIVIEVKFAEWTRDRILRAPVFLAVQTGVAPRNVRRGTSE